MGFFNPQFEDDDNEEFTLVFGHHFPFEFSALLTFIRSLTRWYKVYL